MNIKNYLTKSWMLLGLGILGNGYSAPSDSGRSSGTELRFAPNGKFKIVQFTDTHLQDMESLSDGDNSDTAQIARAIQITTALFKDMNAILDLEKPDLVIFTGDNVLAGNNQAAEYWKKLVKPLNDRNIPWAAIMGNHDQECTMKTNRVLMKIVEKLPGSMASRGPVDAGGGGNYVLTIKGARSPQTKAALICIDSGDYADKQLSDGYAWIPDNRIAWVRQQIQSMTRNNNNQPLPTLFFLHIPLPEFDEAVKTGAFSGNKKENVCCPKINSGMFAAILESRSVMGVFAGHDHNNDYVASFHNIALAYGRKTGAFCYHDLPSGARVIELEEGSQSFSTWIRTGDLAEENRLRFPDAFSKPANKPQ